MKQSIFAALLLLPLATSCEQAQVSASEAMDGAAEMASKAADAIKNINFDDLGVDAAKEKVAEWSKDAIAKLGEIKDSATAEKMVAAVSPLIEGLGKAKSFLGENMPSMESLTSAASGLKEKFAGDESILNVLKPLMEKIQGLVK